MIDRKDYLMKTRLISAAVAILILVPNIVFSGTILLPISVALLSVLGLFEMFRCCGVHKNPLFVTPYYLLAVVSVFAIYFSAEGYFNVSLSAAFLLAVLFLMIWTYPCTIFSKGKLSVTDASTATVGALYVLAGMLAVLYIRRMLPLGEYVFGLVFLGAWITDSGAYFCGRAFGKHKLAPDISPKKTIEGSVGGIIICILFFALYGWICEMYADSIAVSETVRANYPVLLISAFFISMVSQIGDLAMSLLKRHYGIKDFGKIMPGHGGAVDRFDSVFAVAITLLICCVVAASFSEGHLFVAVPL